MSQTITIKPVTRIEGHAKVTVVIDEEGKVTDARLHVTQFRGFEKFCEGRPFYEMPSLVERICGICPVSHSIASAKACDAILGVQIPRSAQNLRRILNCGEFIQSHALSFFYLSGPDLALGFSSDPCERNILGLAKINPSFAMDGIRLRKIGQQIIEYCTGRRIHPSWVVPGGVNKPLSQETRRSLLALLPDGFDIIRRTLDWFKASLENFRDEIRTFANFPTLFVSLIGSDGNVEYIDGKLRFIDSKGKIVIDGVEPASYSKFIEEKSEEFSYLKSPYYGPLGYPDGIYRSGPAARLNSCDGLGAPEADQELAEFKDLERGPVLSSFHNHYARLIEILHSLELMEHLLNDSEILNDHVRSFAKNNEDEGIGVVEAPRGLLIHHYRVNKEGLITWANMVVATGNNSLAMNRGLLQTARRFINSETVSEGALNRIEGLIRCFDPCLSCSTHVIGKSGLRLELVNHMGESKIYDF